MDKYHEYCEEAGCELCEDNWQGWNHRLFRNKYRWDYSKLKVYSIKNDTSGKVYVGLTCEELEDELKWLSYEAEFVRWGGLATGFTHKVFNNVGKVSIKLEKELCGCKDIIDGIDELNDVLIKYLIDGVSVNNGLWKKPNVREAVTSEYVIDSVDMVEKSQVCCKIVNDIMGDILDSVVKEVKKRVDVRKPSVKCPEMVKLEAMMSESANMVVDRGYYMEYYGGLMKIVKVKMPKTLPREMDMSLKKRVYDGKIYKLTSLDGEKIYIGSTIMSLEKRFNGHKSGFNKYYKSGSKCKGNYCGSYEILKMSGVQIELIESFKCNDIYILHLREAEYIELNKDVCVNLTLPVKLTRKL